MNFQSADRLTYAGTFTGKAQELRTAAGAILKIIDGSYQD
jgi:hypothetical protein